MESQHDTQVASFIESIDLVVAKLARYSRGVSREEMEWSPSGLRNSLCWILRHCAGLLWASLAHVSGQSIPDYVREAGIASSVLNGVTFKISHGNEFASDADALHSELNGAWAALKEFLTNSSHAWETRTLVFERKERNVWALLWHNMADISYHTGQASSWRKLLAGQRKRKQR
ncbi:DinB family protein [Candidatus Bipolaricaulota bacterium]